jgi:hypothetical protein
MNLARAHSPDGLVIVTMGPRIWQWKRGVGRFGLAR